MIMQLLANGINAIHNTLIPVVHAEVVNSQSSREDTLLDRLKAAFTPNENEAVTQEVASILTYVQTGPILGCLIGGAIYSKNQYMHFMENCTASQYQSHVEAKADFTKRLVTGGIKGACIWGVKSFAVCSVFGVLVNLLPVVRGKYGVENYVASGLASGTLAGYMFRDSAALGFELKKPTGRYSYNTLCMMRGVGYGLLLSTSLGIYATATGSWSSVDQLRKWDKYWRQRQSKRTELQKSE